MSCWKLIGYLNAIASKVPVPAVLQDNIRRMDRPIDRSNESALSTTQHSSPFTAPLRGAQLPCRLTGRPPAFADDGHARHRVDSGAARSTGLQALELRHTGDTVAR